MSNPPERPDPHASLLVARPSSGRVFSAERRVRLADASPGGRLRFDACARYLQDIANDDSRDAGTPNPTAWIARRTVIRVDCFPQYLDRISLSTWCSGLGPRWAERRYSIADAAFPGSTIEAATLWVHINMATMKPIPLPAGFEEQFGQAAHGRTVSARQQLSTRTPDDATSTGPWPLRFADFDVLGHVNNSVYWAIVEQHLALRRDMRSPLEVALEHHDAIDPGDAVEVTVRDAPDGFDLWVLRSGGGDAATGAIAGAAAAVVSVRSVAGVGGVGGVGGLQV